VHRCGGPRHLSRYRHNAHSTGHPKRLAREGITEADAFGSAIYSKEELVAEMGAAYLCAEAGISNTVIANQAAYVAGWLK
jgi:antirestriction protein ArdC